MAAIPLLSWHAAAAVRREVTASIAVQAGRQERPCHGDYQTGGAKTGSSCACVKEAQANDRLWPGCVFSNKLCHIGAVADPTAQPMKSSTVPDKNITLSNTGVLQLV